MFTLGPSGYGAWNFLPTPALLANATGLSLSENDQGVSVCE